MLLLTTAQALAAAGCCVIPTRADGTKAPAVRWQEYQHQHPTPEQLWTWFASGQYDGLGIVAGTISGNLEMLELEGRALHLAAPLGQLLVDHDASELWARLNAGYLERTPSGGIHWLYRIQGTAPPGNTKLARRPSTAAELDEWKTRERAKANKAIADEHARQTRYRKIDEATPVDVPQVLIETRGEGGYVVVAPSGGRTHPTGLTWSMLAGAPATIPTITAAEHQLLHSLAATLDEMPAAAPTPIRETRNANPVSTTSATDLAPGEDYNQRATWDDILIPHGWTPGPTDNTGRRYWTRPGKDARDGFSATTGGADDGIDRLYVFTSSTTFDTETPYLKFAAYAHLEHGDDFAAAAKQLRADGYGSPLEEPRSLGFTGAPEPTPADTPPPPGLALVTSEPTSYSLTDDGNALRLVDRHSDAVRFCPQRGLWLRWTGHRWVWDEAETIRELARGIARDLPNGSDPARKHRQKSLSNPSIGYMVRLAQTDPRITVHIDQLDAHPYELNTPGGVVDLRTGQLHPSNPAALHTRSTSVAPDFNTPAPRWQRFLADTFAGDPELTTYVQRLLGVSLIGEVLEQMLPFAFGAGANGKTTLLNAIQRIIGIGDAGYSISAPAEILLATHNNDHPATIAQLAGARMVVTSELEDGQHFAEARVKNLTGSEPINARFMRQNPFTFIPSHTLWLVANHQPAVKAGGPAFWRRITMLPFLHTVPVEQRDPHLEQLLVDEEGPAVLAWCIQGAAAYLAGGLGMPDSVKTATKAYERDQDTVGRFVDDMCETGPVADEYYKTKVAAVRADYESWCRTEGEFPISAKAFTQALRTRFDVWSERSNSSRYYRGIRLREEATPSGEPAPWELRWDQK